MSDFTYEPEGLVVEPHTLARYLAKEFPDGSHVRFRHGAEVLDGVSEGTAVIEGGEVYLRVGGHAFGGYVHQANILPKTQ